MSAPQHRLAILGARVDGGLPLVLEIILENPDLAVVALVDDDESLWGTELFGLPVIGNFAALRERKAALGVTAASIAIADLRARDRLAGACRELGLQLTTLVHSRAHISPLAEVGEGGFLAAGVMVLPGAQVGPLVRISAGAVISHAVRVGYCNNIGPNATLTGRSSTGDYAFIGAASTVLNDIHVGDNAVVGAGAVVTRDVAAGLTVVGVPAKPVSRPKGDD